MTFSKVEIVYDTDEDENGQETRSYYETEEIGRKNVMILLFSDADGMVTAKGAMVFTHTETGFVNEIAIDLKKI